MIRVYRWVAVVVTATAVVALLINIWESFNNNIFIGGTLGHARIVAQSMFPSLLTLLFAGVLYAACDIAERFRRTHPTTDQDRGTDD